MEMDTNEERKKSRRENELLRTSTMYRARLAKCFQSPPGVSPRQAIAARCLQCVGDRRYDVRYCSAYECALWEFRPYQTDDTEDDADD